MNNQQLLTDAVTNTRKKYIDQVVRGRHELPDLRDKMRLEVLAKIDILSDIEKQISELLRGKDNGTT